MTGGPSHSCRLCGGDFHADSALRIDRAPRAAQGFVLPEEAASDVSVVLEIRECADCGLVQSCSPPVPGWQQVIRSSAYSSAMQGVRREQFEYFVETYGVRGSRVLEAGCGPSDLLDLMGRAGMRPFGLEAGTVAVQSARDAGLEVESGYPTRGKTLAGGPFDGFITVNVLEHAVDPRDFLRGVRENLTSGAVGMVEVPSFERMQEEERYYDFIGDHLSYFTARTLRIALETSGFDLLEMSRDWWADDLVAFVRVSHSSGLQTARSRVEAVASDVRAFIDSHARDGGVVAVWGASHQALTLLCLAGGERVSYVIDSAPFKQGLLTPGTHLPVMAPAHLREQPPDAVLVMAAGYSDEVVRLLTSEWGFAGVVAVLRADRVDVMDRDT